MPKLHREFERAAAEAFADIDDIRLDCYHYLNDGFNPTIQARIAKRYGIGGLNPATLEPIKKYSEQVVDTALAELQHPTPSDNPKAYAWTGNQRAAFAGISNSTWHRNNLCEQVEFIINNIRSNASSAWRDIQRQLET